MPGFYGTTDVRMSAIALSRVPPERRERAAEAAPAGGCCCCCCCCLHTIGGIYGAATAKAPVYEPPAIPPAGMEPGKLVPRLSAAAPYWISVLLTCGAFWALLMTEEPPAAVLILIAVFGPLLQMAASLVSACAIALSRTPGRRERFRHLSQITLRSFLGALIGAAIMVPILALVLNW